MGSQRGMPFWQVEDSVLAEPRDGVSCKVWNRVPTTKKGNFDQWKTKIKIILIKIKKSWILRWENACRRRSSNMR